MQRLVTREDPWHAHKLCGALCLLNFGFQTWRHFSGRGALLNAWTLAPHLALHATTFIFHVLPRRQKESKAAMYIWEELRLHSMVFAYRGVAAILLPRQHGFAVSMAAMAAADLVSLRFGTPGVSTVRGLQLRVGARAVHKELAGLFFSTSQMGATLITTGLLRRGSAGGAAEHHLAMLVFATLPPIQTSAFGMTLIRKSLISQQVWTVVYSAELLFVYYLWFQCFGNLDVVPIALALYALRRAGVDKYLLWIAVFVLDARLRARAFL